MSETFIIRCMVDHPSISDHSECVGVFVGDYQDADELVRRLNQEDADNPGRYFRSYGQRLLTLDNYKTIIGSE